MTIFGSFPAALHADAPAPDHAGNANLYGWLIGSWEMDAARHLAPGNIRKSRGEIHFGWILGGRAIQDVWYIPGEQGQTPPLCGTTLRVYDPGLDAWHIIWVDPIGQRHLLQLGKAVGKNIVQEGTDSSGTILRWRFTEITPDSFHWIGERRDGDGWTPQVEFFARRRQE
ncbi:MAG TPA: hypothetical protein VNS34_17260 [Rhizobiaceae bacterium]|nr:hypothetical protein [Rhizobiaceae bacterium]